MHLGRASGSDGRGGFPSGAVGNSERSPVKSPALRHAGDADLVPLENGIVLQDGAQMPFVEDQHAVKQLTAQGADEPPVAAARTGGGGDRAKLERSLCVRDRSSAGDGDGQRPNIGQIWLLQGIKSDYHRSDGHEHLSTSRYFSWQREPRRLVSHLIQKLAIKKLFEKSR